MPLKVLDVSTVSSLEAEQNLRGPALCTLSNYESWPGLCSRLMDIITANGPPSHDDVRLAASIYLKDMIERYWKNSLIISEHEKTHLRNKLLSHFREKNNQIAQMLAIIFSKIAHIDYPLEWPELFHVLAQQLKEADILTSYRIFEVLFHTISKLSEKNLRAEGTSFAEIFSHLFDYCWKLWQKDKGIIYDSFSLTQSCPKNPLSEQQLHLTCERWLLCLSTIHGLIILFGGNAKSVKVPPVKEVCKALIRAVKLFVPYYSSFQADPKDPKLSFINKTCINLMNCLVKILYCHPNSFGDEIVLRPILEFCLKEIMNPGHEKSALFEQLLIECMVMVKSVLKCIQYKGSSRRLNFNSDSVNAGNVWINISNDVNSLLPNVLVKELCKILITRYFLLTGNELEEWSQDPEAFHYRQSMFGDLVRPCEALYIVLFENNRELLGPFIISILHQATNDCPVEKDEGRPEMLLREAAYTAVGHVYYELSGKINFNDWFKEVLCPEIYDDRPDMRIVHRKIAFIVEEWALVKVGDKRKPVFDAMIRLLRYDDLAVRLAACRSLGLLVKENKFLKEDFTDLIPSYWDLCFKLIKVVKKRESKGLVLDLILSMIKCFGEKTIPFACELVDVFQQAWKVSTGNSGLQIRVLRALTYFVRELGIHSPVCYYMLLPILKECIIANDPDNLNILKYGILLWESTISHAPSMASQLLELFPYLSEVMKKNFYGFNKKKVDNFDHLKISNKIIDGYIRLWGTTFSSEHASVIAQLREVIVWDVNDEMIKDTEVLESGTSIAELPLICSIANFLRRVEGLNTDEIYPELNKDDIDPDDGCERPKGQSMLSVKKQKLNDKFQVLKGKLNSRKLKDTKTSMEQKDEKDIGVLDEIKKKYAYSSSDISTRSTATQNSEQSFSAVAIANSTACKERPLQRIKQQHMVQPGPSYTLAKST